MSARRVVWKYSARPGAEPTLVPGLPLRVDLDPTGALSAWSLVDPTQEPSTPSHEVIVRATGDPLPDGEEAWDYLNTFVSGPFVFHAFAREIPEAGDSDE